jgi:hypothetical protein
MIDDHECNNLIGCYFTITPFDRFHERFLLCLIAKLFQNLMPENLTKLIGLGYGTGCYAFCKNFKLRLKEVFLYLYGHLSKKFTVDCHPCVCLVCLPTPPVNTIWTSTNPWFKHNVFIKCSQANYY